MAEQELAQDRISILAPDGSVRWQPIAGPELTIGRAAECAVALDYANVSRQHARVLFDGASYRVVDLDSAGGTYLGNVRLLPGVPEVWTPDKALRIGDCWLRLEPAARPASGAGSRSGSGGTEGNAAGPAGRGGAARAAIFAPLTELAVDPGGAATLTVGVLNQGAVVDHFQVGVTGLPAAWLPAPPPLIRLLPGAQQQVTLAILPPRSPESRAGSYPLIIQAVSQDAPDQIAEARATLTVSAFCQFEAELRPQRQSGPLAGDFQLQIRNRGNAGLLAQLAAADPEEGCRYAFDPPQASVAPGEEGTARLAVQPKAPLAGAAEHSYPFTVSVSPAEAPELAQRVQGQWTHTPARLELSLEPARVSAPWAGAFALRLSHQAPIALTVRLEAADAEQGCDVSFDPPEAAVPPGEERRVRLTVRSRTPPPAKPVAHAFTVTARLGEVAGAARQVQGEWEELPKPEGAPQPGCAFWLLWALATALGGAVGGTMGALANLSRVPAPVGWAITGAISGLAQWLVLRGRLSGSGWWIAASAAGWAIGGPLGAGAGLLTWAVAALPPGVLQWLALRGKVRAAGLWVPASILALGVGGGIGIASGPPVFSPWGWSMAWLVGSAVAGAIGGLALVLLLRRPVAGWAEGGA